MSYPEIPGLINHFVAAARSLYANPHVPNKAAPMHGYSVFETEDSDAYVAAVIEAVKADGRLIPVLRNPHYIDFYLPEQNVVTGTITTEFRDTELLEAVLKPRTIHVLAMHQDEFDVFTPTTEQQEQIDAGDLIVGIIRYATSLDEIPT